MRQVGFLAAACDYALDHHVERLAEDHQKAKDIGAVLEAVSYVTKVETIETNIVIFYVDAAIGDDKQAQGGIRPMAGANSGGDLLNGRVDFRGVESKRRRHAAIKVGQNGRGKAGKCESGVTLEFEPKKPPHR